MYKCANLNKKKVMNLIAELMNFLITINNILGNYTCHRSYVNCLIFARTVFNQCQKKKTKKKTLQPLPPKMKEIPDTFSCNVWN